MSSSGPSRAGRALLLVVLLAGCRSQPVDSGRPALPTTAVVDGHAFPPHRTVAPAVAGVPLTKDQAGALAVALSTRPDAARVVSAVETRFSTLDRDGETFSAAEPQAARVWVVLVDGPNLTDGGPAVAPREVERYGTVLDVTTHRVLELCLGVACA